MSLAYEDRADGWQRDYARLNTTCAALLAQLKQKTARIEELEAELAAHNCPTMAAGRSRTRIAAEWSVPAARELLKRTDLTEQQRAIIYQRWQHPGWTWAQVAASAGTDKDSAASMFRRLAEKAGLI